MKVSKKKIGLVVGAGLATLWVLISSAVTCATFIGANAEAVDVEAQVAARTAEIEQKEAERTAARTAEFEQKEAELQERLTKTQEELADTQSAFEEAQLSSALHEVEIQVWRDRIHCSVLASQILEVLEVSISDPLEATEILSSPGYEEASVYVEVIGEATLSGISIEEAGALGLRRVREVLASAPYCGLDGEILGW